MSALKVYKFNSLDELTLFFAGGVIGTDISGWASAIAKGDGPIDVPPLVGKTLVFTEPTSATCTFTQGADSAGRLKPAEVKAQIESAIAGTRVRFIQGKIAIVESTPAQGVSISSTSTALAQLGFGTGVATVGKVYGSPYVASPAAPYFVQAYITNDGAHVVYTFE